MSVQPGGCWETGRGRGGSYWWRYWWQRVLLGLTGGVQAEGSGITTSDGSFTATFIPLKDKFFHGRSGLMELVHCTVNTSV